MSRLRDVVTRAAASMSDAEEWALVLTSAGIPSRLRWHESAWEVVVSADDEARARQTLEDYDRESRQAPAVAAAPLEYGRTYAGLVIAGLLLAFHAVTVETAAEVAWWQRGNAAAARILNGELWRTVTALTLHASLPHVVSNALSCVVFCSALCHSLGPGVGLSLLLLTGALGNFTNAFVRGAPHQAVGASTAIFGAVGILGALQLMRRVRVRPSGRPWIPIAAALALLALLGAGEDTDVLAHLFGFVAGVVAGVAAATVLRRAPGRGPQTALAVFAAAVVLGAWLLALGIAAPLHRG